jgi:Fe-Mn family superoxide dismutase
MVTDMKPETYPFVVRPLPCEYDALAPLLDEETLLFHHDKHYQNYVEGLNHILADYPGLQSLSLRELLLQADTLPGAIRSSVLLQAGGVYAHELYFDSMKSPEGQEPSGALKEAIERDFGSMKVFKEQIVQKGMSVVGSGWVWLVSDGNGKLSAVETADQGVPDLSLFTPIFPIDVWEHAYYLRYRDRREEYLDKWFSLIHWRKAERRYESSLQVPAQSA